MSPRDKAQELVSKMQKDFIFIFSKEISRKHALILVDEFLENSKMNFSDYKRSYAKPTHFLNYWQEVREEIQKL